VSLTFNVEFIEKKHLEKLWIYVFFLQLMPINNVPFKTMDCQLKADQTHQYSLCLCSDFNLQKEYCVKTYKHLKHFVKEKFVILIRKSLTLTVIINIKIPNKILFRS
jgi:hypothetical protein